MPSDNEQNKSSKLKARRTSHRADQANTSGRKNSNRTAAFKSVSLHSLILIALLVSFNFSDKPLTFAAQPSVSVQQNQPEIVQATFIDSNVIEQQKREKAQAEAQARQRRQEELRKKKAREQAERDRKRRAEDAKRKKQEEAAKQEQQRLDALERERQKEIEIQKKREQQEAMQQQLQQELADQLAQEQADMSKAQQRRVMTEIQKYQALIMQKIRRNLTIDQSFKGKACTLNVKLSSTGLVLAVNVVEGDSALCRASQTAVLKAETLPVSEDPAVFAQMKNLNIIVRPDL